MAVSWTLEKELRGLVNGRSINDALWKLGLTDYPEAAVALEEKHGWRQGGAETYIYRFKVTGARKEHDVLLKAVTAFSMSLSLNQIVEEWVRRRQLLAEAGVRTPTLYFAGRALLVEQYVGEKLSQWLQRNTNIDSRMTDQVFRLAAVMDRHGFSPIHAFKDLRTDGEGVYIVDFGADLGPPGVRRQRSERLLNEARRWLVSVGNQEIDLERARAVYTFHLDGEARNGPRFS
jgi:hypothetical protein